MVVTLVEVVVFAVVVVAGIGISMALISLVVAIYYNVIMAYTLYYFFSSMQKVLPWTKCKDVSNTTIYRIWHK